MHFLLRYLIPLNVIFDIVLLIVQKGGIFPMTRAVMLLVLIIYFTLSKPKNVNIYSNILFFSIYVLIIVLFSTDVLESFINSIKVIISILLFIIGYSYFNSLKRFLILHKSILIAYFLIFINIIISNIFNLGESQYSEEENFMAGNLSDNWNLLTYSLLLFPMIYNQYPKTIISKKLSLVLFFILIIFVLLSVKRIAIAGLLIGMLIYGFYNLKLKSFFRVVFLSVFFLGISYPIYSPILNAQFEARSDRFEEGAIEEEGRWLESIFVWEEIIEFNDPKKQLFGLEAFNSAGNYADGFFGKRMLHIDYNNIVNTIGLVGLILYFTIFFQIFRKFRKFYKAPSKLPPIVRKQLKGTFYALFLTQFITSIAGQMYALSFRMIIFIYLGAIIGLLKNSIIKKEVINNK